MQKKNSRKSNHRATPSLTLPPRRGGRRGVETHSYYPAFLNLKGKKTVVIGGGKVAERKILVLLKTGANITVISPEITKRIAREKLRGSLKHIPRQYRKGDVKNTFLVIAATDSEEINKKVSEEAPCLVNVVDIPSLCNFIVPSVIQRGLLTIAVSTSGVSPALSKSIRLELERLYGPEFREYLQLVEKVRKKAIEKIPDKQQRTRFLKSIATEEVIRKLREQGARAVARGTAKSEEHRAQKRERNF